MRSFLIFALIHFLTLKAPGLYPAMPGGESAQVVNTTTVPLTSHPRRVSRLMDTDQV